MIQIAKDIWIGDSDDAAGAPLATHKITGILNVAHDLCGVRGWPEGFEYAQAGLVDGPGNTMAAYYAAVFKLLSMTLGGRRVLVHDHEAGSRSVACIIMSQHALYRRGWEHWLDVVQQRLGHCVSVHEAHKQAFNRINWRLFCTALEGVM